MRQQIADLYPELDLLMNYPPGLTCGDCEHFDRNRERCTYRNFRVKAEQAQCHFLIPRSSKDDDEYD